LVCCTKINLATLTVICEVLPLLKKASMTSTWTCNMFQLKTIQSVGVL
jgi:hypothetical protein